MIEFAELTVGPYSSSRDYDFGLSVCMVLSIVVLMVVLRILSWLCVRSYKNEWDLGADEWLQDYDYKDDNWTDRELQKAEAHVHPDASEWVDE